MHVNMLILIWVFLLICLYYITFNISVSYLIDSEF